MTIEELKEIVDQLVQDKPGLNVALYVETEEGTETWLAKCLVRQAHPIDPLTGDKEDGPNREREMLVFYPVGW